MKHQQESDQSMCSVECNVMNDTINQFVNQLIGKRLTSLTCAAEILNFCFDTLTLHAMGCSRIIKNDKILVTVLDYQSWDQIHYENNDEYFNIERFRADIVGGTVVSVRVSLCNDLIIGLDNGVTVECLVANGPAHYEEEQEQWVLFEQSDDCSGRYLAVYNTNAEFLPPASEKE